jgi:uncharacterized protein
MSQTDQQTDAITLVISEVVKPNRIQEYEAWSWGINQAARQYEGCIGVNVIRPLDHAYPEYVVIVKFDNYDNFRRWKNSPTYHQWIEKARGLVVDRSYRQFGGLEIWFSLPKNVPAELPKPAYYKQVILGVMAVYPLILLSNALLSPFLAGLPPLIGLLISVIFVSSLLTYPVMPLLTKLLGFWLYPASRKSARKGA